MPLLDAGSSHAGRQPGRSAYAYGLACAIGTGVSFGLLGTLANFAYRAGMGSATFTGVRAFIGASVLAVLLLLHRRLTIDLRTLSRREQLMLFIAVASNATLNLALFAAYSAMTVALVVAIYFTYPLIVAFVSVAIGRERFTRARVAGLIFTTAGLVLVVGDQVGADARLSMVGLGCAAVTAICQASYLLVSRSGYTRVPPEQATFLILAGGAVLAAGMMVATDLPAGRLVIWVGSTQSWIAVIIAGTVSAALAKVWLLRAVRIIGGTRTAVVLLLEPLTGVILAALALGQAIGLPEAIGGIGILVGAALVQRPSIATPVEPHGASAGLIGEHQKFEISA